MQGETGIQRSVVDGDAFLLRVDAYADTRAKMPVAPRESSVVTGTRHVGRANQKVEVFALAAVPG